MTIQTFMAVLLAAPLAWREFNQRPRHRAKSKTPPQNAITLASSTSESPIGRQTSKEARAVTPHVPASAPKPAERDETMMNDFQVAPEWRLTPQEAAVFGMLVDNKVLTASNIKPLLGIKARAGWRPRVTDIVSRLKAKIEPYGIRVKGDVKHGYKLDVATAHAAPAPEAPQALKPPLEKQVGLGIGNGHLPPPISLPSVGGETYLYSDGQLYRSGEAVSVRAK